VEALPGPGRTSSPVLRTGVLADHSPIRDFGDRTCTHGFAGVAYQAAGEAGAPAVCKRCGGRFASRMHIDDLNRVLPQIGFDYRIEEGQFTWQEICPACKRKLLSLAQLRLRAESHG
jgi:hypothetical protein